MIEWKPIETAPKDGAYLLLYSEDEGVLIGTWSAGDWYKDGFVTDSLPVEEVTRWMSLPEPPA